MVMAVEDEVVGALKKSEKSKKRKERNNDMLAANPVYIVKDVGVKGDKSFEEETKMKSDNEGVERMKKKKKSAGDNKRGALMEDANGITVEKAAKKKRKREVQSKNNESQDTANDVSVDNGDYVNSTATEMLESKSKHEKMARTITDSCTEGKMDKVKWKNKNMKEKGEDDQGSVDVATGLTCAEGIADFSVNVTQASGVGNDNISRKQVKDSSKDPKRKNSKKKVIFSNELKVSPKSNVPQSGKGQNKVVELIRGKRFSKIEDEIVKQAVFKYIEAYNLGEEGLDMVLNCRSHPEVKNCWKEIGAAIRNRPYLSVYHRAQILFRRSESNKWSEEEKALILEYVKLNGNEWKTLADKLGSHKIHVRDTWRRIYLPNLKKGPWSQDEYQNLFDFVNSDLQLRILKEKRSRHGMLRDNISFTAISNKLSTRTCGKCCSKWYSHLSSPMVAEGIWSDSDDYRLIGALYTLDATCIENVDWDNLLEHRPGELCLKRWKQMVLLIGNHGSKPFSEQVEVLAKRYCPSLIEVREAWDSKPVVP
ncbi:PREDICTED: cyclin-D-binding Myb-like transcription factor 1 [Ipomoea nil]|uniref:cyclin-D-binding Myb-like transcription factor 1 n=1 Tax=Ipomoea nil TaxID=35883 RepID=UPI0009014669|nr:PREDICTED: cyclin-D-binding Myb-like transcription factor 1 [Ipomoea nil]XP_019173950.1 PREDICTED: cyclin-D-binding Myb-like transcription factor 1 [Ipomoea nil]